jgi:hypothetical protein
MQEPQQKPTQHWSVAAMVGVVAVPVVLVWLGLAGIIIYKGATDPDVLDKIEGLLTALAVLTIPAQQIVIGVFRKWQGGD